jgi:foldase protein PrsA
MKTKNVKKFKTVIALALFALILTPVAAAFTGCGGSGGKSEAVAELGDVTITEDQLSAFTELMFFLYGYDFFSDLSDEEKNTYKADTLDTMIQAAAMKQHFSGEDVFPEDSEERLAQFKDMIKQAEGTEGTFREKGITDDTLRYYMETQYYFQALASEVTEDGALPTEAEIEAYYAAHEQEFPDTEERRVSHILVGDAEHSDADRQLAEDIRAKIADGEESFEDMALEYGTDGTKDTGGDLDFQVKEYYVPEFGEAAFSLPQGELSGIVETEFGFHILKVTDIRSGRSLDAQREAIRSTLTYELYEKKTKELVDEFGAVYLSDKYPPPGERGVTEAEVEGTPEIQE